MTTDAAQRVAIIGSRDYPDLRYVAETVLALPKGTLVISGGARGVDRQAEVAADRAGLDVVSIPVIGSAGRWSWTITCNSNRAREWVNENFAAYRDEFQTFRDAAFHRNKQVVQYTDRVIAFHWNNSNGTANAIQHARDLGIPVEVRS